jgi:formate dehydrogenase major subunit
MARHLLSGWPVIRQLSSGGDGTGAEATSPATAALEPRTTGAHVARSVCPYCGVGCGQIIFHNNRRLIAIEGDSESPISGGHLCPKGAASFELLTHAARATRVKYRAPFATAWQEIGLETAMDMVADRVWQSRDRHFREFHESDPSAGPGSPRASSRGETLMQCPSIAHLGGATLDNEENYLLKKLFSGGLGIVAISNQARI